MYDLLLLHDGKEVDEIISVYGNNGYVVEENLNVLIENEIIFLTDKPELFPKLDMSWFAPFFVTNSIIDIDKNSTYNIYSILTQLNKINCTTLQIRFFYNITFKNIIKIIKFFDNIHAIIKTIDIVLPYSKFINNKLKSIIENFPRINSITVFNSPSNEFINPIRHNSGFIEYSIHNIYNERSCGNISKEYFTPNIKAFTESQKHNTCLNRKISIDTNGNIKNCPSMPQSFGNIKDTTLEEALNDKDFKKYWNITKDDINVCKDCEFRHICTDCRAYLEDPKDIYSKPLKCGYDPYTNKWEEWSTNPLKQKAIVYYGMQDLIKKDEV